MRLGFAGRHGASPFDFLFTATEAPVVTHNTDDTLASHIEVCLGMKAVALSCPWPPSRRYR